MQRCCPRCAEGKSYRLASGYWRCARCRYTFHDFSRRFINAGGLSCQQWLWLLKLFELNVPAQEVAVQLGIAYATALKAMDCVRRAIVARALDAPTLYAHGVWPGPGQPKRQPQSEPPVFGLIELNGFIVCDVLPDITPESILHFKRNFHLKTACVGNIVYTAPYQHYRLLVACGPSLWPTPGFRHDDRRIPADAAGFWPFARRRLKALRGILPAHFPLYLKELEFRYNHRGQSLLSMLAEAICGLIPDARGNTLPENTPR